MARPIRMESAGGVYHVLNSGKRRAEIFRRKKAKKAFLECLYEACEKTGWQVHAWCLMPNHYHLALSTPQANLVEGMSWLQSAFAARYSELRGKSGHVFKDRYKSLVVDPVAGLGPVCHFIHLNPVEGEICKPSGLSYYRWSSLGWLLDPKLRTSWYDPRPALNHAGHISDTAAGRKKYLTYLAALAEDKSAREAQRFERMSKGWVIGTGSFSKAVMRENQKLVGRGSKIARKSQAAREEIWQELLASSLRTLGRDLGDLAREGKSVSWKLAIAAFMKTRTTVTNRWLGETLQMGNLHEVSRKVAAWAREPDAVLLRKLQKIPSLKA